MKKMHQSGSAHVVIIICLVVALLGALGWIFYQNFVSNDSESNNITNYAECAADKDSKSQPTYPEVCVTKNGKRFVNLDQPSNYEECVKAPGSRIQESYPTVCVAKDGPSFTNPDQKIETEN